VIAESRATSRLRRRRRSGL